MLLSQSISAARIAASRDNRAHRRSPAASRKPRRAGSRRTKNSNTASSVLAAVQIGLDHVEFVEVGGSGLVGGVMAASDRSSVSGRRSRWPVAWRCAERLAPWAGIEPATFRLTVERSTAELPGNRPESSGNGPITKPNCFAKHEAWAAFVRRTLAKLRRRGSGGHARNRTGVQGFAVLCVTTPPRGH